MSKISRQTSIITQNPYYTSHIAGNPSHSHSCLLFRSKYYVLIEENDHIDVIVSLCCLSHRNLCTVKLYFCFADNKTDLLSWRCIHSTSSCSYWLAGFPLAHHHILVPLRNSCNRRPVKVLYRWLQPSCVNSSAALHFAGACDSNKYRNLPQMWQERKQVLLN